jgi:MFS family permease
MAEHSTAAKERDENRSWLNRNVFAFGLTSFLSDFGHEMATSILPQFMAAIGLSAATLGFIEGFADALSSFARLGAGYHSDKIGRRKAWTVAGYILTALSKAVFAFAFAWPLILLGRVVAWLGRGIRGPLRDAMLAASVAPAQRGKAFGFHRAGDTLGAVAGPFAAFMLLEFLERHPGLPGLMQSALPSISGAPGAVFRGIFLLTLIPGLFSVIAVAFLVTEKKHMGNPALRLTQAIRALPGGYRNFLLAVGLFGMSDFAPTLMILRSTQLLEPQMGIIGASKAGALLYLLRNLVYAAASYPIGALSSRFSMTRYLAVGYGIAVLTFLGFALAPPSLSWLIFVFCLAGVFIAWEDTIEGVAVRDYVSDDLAGTAYGMLGVVNGVGDFCSSLAVGLLWTVFGPEWGFGFAAVVGFSGMVLMWNLPQKRL